MRYLKLLFFVACTITFTGCFEILEEIKLNKKGSGMYTMSLDMSQILKDPMAKQMLLEPMKKDSRIPMDKDGKLEVDTVMYMKNLPDMKVTEGHDKLWGTAKLATIMSESKEKMDFVLSFEFDKISEIEHFFEQMKAQASGESAMVLQSGVMPGGSFSLKKKLLKRLPVPKVEGKSPIDDQSMAMMKMMLAGATFTTVYDLPCKVKKVTIPNAVVEKKMVKVTTPVIDIIEQNAKMDGEIKMK